MCFPFSFSVPGEMFRGLKEEQPPRPKRRAPRAHGHGGGASPVPRSLGQAGGCEEQPGLPGSGAGLLARGDVTPGLTSERLAVRVRFNGTTYCLLENVIKSEITRLTYGLLAPSN